MTSHTSECKQPETPGSKLRKAHYAILGGVCALVIALYAWSAKPGFLELSSSGATDNYYNLLVQGFQARQLNLKREVPPALAQQLNAPDSAANSLDWGDRIQLLDLSYYRGKLYFYFGVTPAVVVFWPYAVLTGHYLSHQDAVVIFFTMGFLAGVGLLWMVWRRYFAEVSGGVMAGCVVALGWGQLVLGCMPRSGVYEVAISCGYAGTMVALLLIWQALHGTQGRAWWLAGASLAYGLAVGARPSLLLGAVMLLGPVLQSVECRVTSDKIIAPGLRSFLPRVTRRVSHAALLAAVGPITVIGLGLLYYNHLRFDNPLEFGHQYALSAGGQYLVQSQIGVQPFSLRYLGCNLQAYFLGAAGWGGHFPFVRDITTPKLAAGHVGMEHVFGILPNLPWVWLALAMPLVWRGRGGEGGHALRGFGLALVLLFGSCALTLGLFFAACWRYEVEFLPGLVWLAVLGLLGLERVLAGRGLWHLAARWSWGLVLAFSVAFNLCVMVGRTSDHYTYRGSIFLRQGQQAAAVVQYQKALKWQRDNAEAHTSLGAALLRQGKVAEGTLHLKEAIRFSPEFATAHANMGIALLEQGKALEAIEHLEQAIRLKPDDADARYNLGVVLFRHGRGAEAVGHLAQTVRLDPNHAEAHNILAASLSDLGRVPEAIEHLKQAVRLKPDYVEAHFNLGTVLFRQSQMPAAVAHFQKTLEFKPQLTWALNSLAWILATETNGAIRNVEEAVRLAERACELTTNSVATYLDTLGVAYSEAGRFNEALQASAQAAAQARATGDQTQAALIESRLKHYREGRPYHAIPKAPGP